MMTMAREAGIGPAVGRRKQWHEVMGAPFPKGTFARIINVLGAKEAKTDFIREAVERELARREAAQRRKRGKARRS